MPILNGKTCAMLLMFACAGIEATAATSFQDSEGKKELVSSRGEDQNQSLCLPNEKSLFDGAVEDDFGLGISVCTTTNHPTVEPVLTVRWFGEGGGDSVSCRIDECAGIVEYSHYVRPRFAEIRIAWTKGDKVQRITEIFDAGHAGEQPKWQVSHRWHHKHADLATVDRFPVRVFGEPMSLLSLNHHFPARPWTKSLLGGGKDGSP